MPRYYDTTAGIIATVGDNGRILNVTKYNPAVRMAVTPGMIPAAISLTVSGINRAIADNCAVRNGIVEGN